MPAYTDFHSHWNGVLPTDDLLKLLLREVERQPSKNETEGFKSLNPTQDQDLWLKVLQTKPVTEPVLFLRVLWGMLGGDLAPSKQESAKKSPFRGAHVAMFAISYIWWCALRADFTLPELPKTTNANREYQELHKATLNLLLKLCAEYSKQGSKAKKIVDEMAGNALRELFCASPVAPFDDAYVARGAGLDMLPPSGMEHFNSKVVEFLGREGIVYVQMSHGHKKIKDAQAALDKYNASHPSSPVIIHWLLLFASHRPWLEDKVQSFEQSSYKKDVKDAMDQLLVYPKRRPLGHVVGIDLAGPEGYAFGKDRARQLVAYTLDELYKIADCLGGKVVFRPHVGEGCALLSSAFTLAETEPYVIVDLVKALHASIMDMKGDKQKRQFEETGDYLVTQVLLHAADAMHVTADTARTVRARSGGMTTRWEESGARAEANVTAFITAIEEYAKSSKNKNWRDRIRIRFGHATHVTADHIARMNKLGIAADCNLGSNLRTGAIALKGKRLEEIRKSELARYANPNAQPYNWDVAELVGTHPLKKMMISKTPIVTVLGTDGQGVEVTEVAQEYKMAREVLGAFGPFTRLCVENAIDQVIGESAKVLVRAKLETGGGRV